MTKRIIFSVTMAALYAAMYYDYANAPQWGTAVTAGGALMAGMFVLTLPKPTPAPALPTVTPRMLAAAYVSGKYRLTPDVVGAIARGERTEPGDEAIRTDYETTLHQMTARIQAMNGGQPA